MIDYRPHLMPKVRSDRIMEAASGMPCTLRIASFVPGLTCAGINTTVGVHLDGMGGKGMRTKDTDMAVAFGCCVCHDIISRVDKRSHEFLAEHYPAAVMERMLRGLIETHALLIDMGVIQIPDARIG